MPLIQEDDTGREDENGGTSHQFWLRIFWVYLIDWNLLLIYIIIMNSSKNIIFKKIILLKINKTLILFGYSAYR